MIKRFSIVISLLAIIMLVSACGVNQEKTNGGEDVKIEKLDKAAVEAYSKNLKGNTFIKERLIEDNSITISYFGDFDSYKKENPKSNIDEARYSTYFDTGDAINKILMEESTRLFKEFEGMNQVKISIPFEGKTYSIDIDRTTAEEYFKVDFKEIGSDDSNEKWRTEVSNKYFTKDYRADFVTKFVTIK
ncbi:hypothetical protein PAECIP111893_00250 [Paenibacillus plantiphilus]|uniref:Uncharacterized protein n=1 Tax=Paenibacillus plantiphilus TaxID=2905650 RepID=A0ABM9BNQ2_9BACL|nr:hypothetical protein [Paenibacillus plantiphilus]CAH1190264.1 hypothetical protein PAECIP111893_00250 [Paenibacillus plantiphilus]